MVVHAPTSMTQVHSLGNPPRQPKYPLACTGRAGHARRPQRTEQNAYSLSSAWAAWPSGPAGLRALGRARAAIFLGRGPKSFAGICAVDPGLWRSRARGVGSVARADRADKG